MKVEGDKKRIGIYGGSYNPVHIGHTSLAQSLLSQGLVDEVWLLVSPLNPLKQDATSTIAQYHHRLSMAQLATEGMEGVVVSDFESRLPIPSYMCNTLGQLTSAYPDCIFTLVIGADNWERFDRWYNSEEILSKYNLLVYRRPGYDIDETALPPSVKVVTTPLYDISSTMIREAVSAGCSTDGMIDYRVRRYIDDYGLYR